MSKMEKEMSDTVSMTLGLDMRTAKVEHYREVYSLLGGDYYLNTSNKNLSGADTYKQVGDKIEYYDINTVEKKAGVSIFMFSCFEIICYL